MTKTIPTYSIVPVGREQSPIPLQDTDESLSPLPVATLTTVLDLYIESLSIRKRAVGHYKSRLRWFGRWLDTGAVDANAALDIEDFAVFELWLHRATCNQGRTYVSDMQRYEILKRLRGALRWACQNELLDGDYSRWVPLTGHALAVDSSPVVAKPKDEWKTNTDHAYPLLQMFLNAKAAAGLSVRTLHGYNEMITRYLMWADESQLDEAQPETIEAYFTNARERGLSPFSILAYYRSLAVFYSWQFKRKKRVDNPMEFVQRPKVPRERKPHVTLNQFQELYYSIKGESWVDHRDRCILLVLFYSGLRASELLSLTLDSIDRSLGVIKVVKGKGAQDRDIPYAPLLLKQLDAYLELRPVCPTLQLFVASYGSTEAEVTKGMLTRDGFRQILRRRCEDAGIAEINPHSFRHGFAMLFLNEGEMEIEAVSKAMGHSSTDLTRRFYADYSTAAMRRQYSKALDRITANR